MKNGLFRKSSVDRLNSPEQLNEYIRVANPGVWLILAAVVLLLAGAFVWSVFGLIETKAECGARAENGKVFIYIAADDAGNVKVGAGASVAGLFGTIKSVSPTPIAANAEDAYLLMLSNLSIGAQYYLLETDISGLEDGIYPAFVTVESLRPISFILR